MATAAAAVKDSLLGVEKPADISLDSRANFLKHAKKDEGGSPYMDQDAFIDAVAPPDEDYHKIKRSQYGTLFQVADRLSRGRISISEWAAFDNLLQKSDAEYEVPFRLFDPEGTGSVKVETLQRIYEENRAKDGHAFDFNSEWASLYTGGKGKKHLMTYQQFAQMLRGLQGERIRQAFQRADVNKDGFITPEQFAQIITEIQGHKLSDHILENLTTVANISTGAKVSYARIRAFLNITKDMDLLDLIIRSATTKTKDGRIDRQEFLEEAARVTRFALYTPMEADILFHFAGLDTPAGRLSLDDFEKVFDASYQGGDRIRTLPGTEVIVRAGSWLRGVGESVHHFALGSIAGAIGAFVVYPIDLVKTRMQNQRSGIAGHALYKNSLDCAQKVIRNEGFTGLYSGVLPQLVGVAPEKAIKLTVNDLVRGYFTDKQTGKINVWPEILAGGSAGACQVVFTNPLEIVKIRLQVQGELAKKSDAIPKRSAMWIVRNLGIMGLYKGASACLLRDVPFSAIYFPTYNHLKKDMFGESPQKQLGVLQLLTAGAIAGMPAAYLTTPCDVIKTRLQVEARKGEQPYRGLTDCAKTVWKQEGFKAFFKGGPARVVRSSPQFGVTLAAYEVISKALPFSMFAGGEGDEAKRVQGKLEPSVGLRAAQSPLSHLKCRNALKVLLDMDGGFGRVQKPERVKLPFSKQ